MMVHSGLNRRYSASEPVLICRQRRATQSLAVIVSVISLGLLPPSSAPAQEQSGEQIYQKRCAACHGPDGEGTAKGHPHALAGDLSVSELAGFIAKSMPADAPGDCVGGDAERVAAYIHNAFYSRQARDRRQPPRIELTHLSGRQYRLALADLIASFCIPGQKVDERGLRGHYITSVPNAENKEAFTRLDPKIQFDFGTSSPLPEKIEPRDFGISWMGSVFAPETGEYEFIVRTEHSANLFVNNMKKPLINAWIKSGDGNEHRATMRLLGGRTYRLEFHFTKAGAGVAKPNKEKAPIVPASVALEWKLPGRAAEPIPQRYLQPIHCPETFLVETPFPPDDRSTGFERGTLINKEWDQATTSGAIETVEYILPRLQELSGVSAISLEQASKLRDFCRQFAERAFRRPLTSEQHQLYIERTFAGAPDLETAVERVVLLVLKSPRFLYHETGGTGADGWQRASRMSFVLWDSLPDAELRSAAAAGQLATREQVAGQVQRMITDPRFDAKIHEFFIQWMKLDQARELAKDVSLFPDFNRLVASDLRTSLELLLEDVIRGEHADFRQFLLTDSLYLNGRLAPIYGAGLAHDAPFQKVVVDAGSRAGVLSHPYLMATFADATTTSPIRRGVFLARSLLGRALRPPPDSFALLPVSLHPNLTTRERVSLQTNAQTCQACHGLINPLGFALEGFDALGRWRTIDNSKMVDATGAYLSRTGKPAKFNGARELGAFLADSEETHTAFIEKLFYYSVQQPVRAFGPQALPELRESFARNSFNIRKLMEAIAVVAALRAEGPSERAATPGDGAASASN
jgi:mono/diheme cytochrome c family protein